MYIESNCLLNSLIALLFFFSKNTNTVTKISKILLKYSHFMKSYIIKEMFINYHFIKRKSRSFKNDVTNFLKARASKYDLLFQLDHH